MNEADATSTNWRSKYGALLRTRLSFVLGRAKEVLLNPKSVWEKIKTEEVTVKELYLNYLSPLLALPFVCWFVGKSLVGQNFLGLGVYRWDLPRAFFVAVLLYVLSQLLIAVAALAVEKLAAWLHAPLGRLGAFKLMAYAITPAAAAGILLLVPGLEVVWGLASLYGAYLLYQGLGALSRRTVEKQIPLFAGALIILLVAVGVLDLAAAKFAPPAIFMLLENNIGNV